MTAVICAQGIAHGSVRVTNSGKVRGAEVVQLYIAPPKGGLFRPEEELRGFARVELEPGEGKTVEFALDERSFAVWSDGWKVPGGTDTVCIGASSRDIRLRAETEVRGEPVPVPVWQAGSWYETPKGEHGKRPFLQGRRCDAEKAVSFVKRRAGPQNTALPGFVFLPPALPMPRTEKSLDAGGRKRVQ